MLFDGNILNNLFKLLNENFKFQFKDKVNAKVDSTIAVAVSIALALGVQLKPGLDQNKSRMIYLQTMSIYIIYTQTPTLRTISL